EVQGEARDAVAEVDHLVQHRVGQAFDPGDPVADLPDHPDVLLHGGGLGPRDLRLDFLQQCVHRPQSNPWKRSSRARSALRTLPSYTSLPTLTLIPPMSAGLSANVVLTPGPYLWPTPDSTLARSSGERGVALSTTA